MSSAKLIVEFNWWIAIIPKVLEGDPATARQSAEEVFKLVISNIDFTVCSLVFAVCTTAVVSISTEECSI